LKDRKAKIDDAIRDAERLVDPKDKKTELRGTAE